MASKTVKVTEEFTDEDALKEREKDEDKAKKKSKDADEDGDGEGGDTDLSKFFMGIAKKDMRNYVVRIRRVSPSIWKGRRIAGIIDQVVPPVNILEIKESYGGGVYQFEIIRGTKLVETIQEEIAGNPKIVFEEDDAPEKKPVEHQDPQDLITDHLHKRLKNAELRDALKQADEMNKEDEPDPSMMPPEEGYGPSEEMVNDIAKKSARMVVRHLEKKGDGMGSMASMLTALAPLLKPPDQTPLINALIAMVAAKNNDNNNNNNSQVLSPKDIVGMVSPLMSEFVKSQSDIRRMEMTNMGSLQSVMMTKMMDVMSSSGAEQDEIDKVRKWIGLATEAFPAIGLLGSAMKPSAPRLPAPAPKRIKRPEPETAEEEAPDAKNKRPDINNITPEQIAKYRVNVFLKAIESEMQVQGDPDTVYDDGFAAIFYSLPKDLRTTIVEGESLAKIITGFKKYGDEELCNNVIKVSMSSQENAKWMVDFFNVVKDVDAERNEPEEGEEGDQTEEPAEETKPTEETKPAETKTDEVKPVPPTGNGLTDEKKGQVEGT